MKRKLNTKGYLVILACLIYSLILYNALDIHSFAQATRIPPFYYITEIFVLIYYLTIIVTSSYLALFMLPLKFIFDPKLVDNYFNHEFVTLIPIINAFTTFIILSAFVLLIFNKGLFTIGAKPEKKKNSAIKKAS
ncbi:MAG: hypothetical protein ACOYT9_03610 [Patescibacteria group bacterium]